MRAWDVHNASCFSDLVVREFVAVYSVLLGSLLPVSDSDT